MAGGVKCCRLGALEDHSTLPLSLPFFPWPLEKVSNTTVRVCLSSQDTARQEASWTRKRQVALITLSGGAGHQNGAGTPPGLQESHWDTGDTREAGRQLLDTVNPPQGSWANRCVTLQCHKAASDFLLGLLKEGVLSLTLTLQMGRMCTACEW